MRLQKPIYVLCVITFLIVSSTSQARPKKDMVLIPANSMITNLEIVIKEIREQTSVPFRFPYKVPASNHSKKYFASIDFSRSVQGLEYRINIDATADCHGIHYCNVGTVTAKSSNKPTIYRDKNENIITVPVKLTHNIQAYYTPGHAMADYFSANIQWQEGGVLYQITWDTNKKAMIAMANSAIHANEQ